MSIALYRRYRPDTFAAVIGQEQVTKPLMASLDAGRINHAYLFSGPRGCGKTTCARIMARCLNCAEGPTSTPCGKCPSCVELATGGSGSLDVVEIDAASHNGVDDARELRERAAFAPVRDRFKIFILDEAHMVTSNGFNALLKIVEEPPEHVKFIFATTEPEKVMGTIRSRTHHYPFRLVAPETLENYLKQLCDSEQMSLDPGVLHLVIRAGGGSVRDSLSVLDQLMAGAENGHLDYHGASALLGYTDSALLAQVIDAVITAQATELFTLLAKVVETGLDPRRFLEDLLLYLRNLLLVGFNPKIGHEGLGVPEVEYRQMQDQASNWSADRISRAADLTAQAITQMTGIIAPSLQIELLGARLLTQLEPPVVAPREQVRVGGVQPPKQGGQNTPVVDAVDAATTKPKSELHDSAAIQASIMAAKAALAAAGKGAVAPAPVAPVEPPVSAVEPSPSPSPVRQKRTTDGGVAAWEIQIRSYWPAVMAQLFKQDPQLFSLINRQVQVEVASEHEIVLRCGDGQAQHLAAAVASISECYGSVCGREIEVQLVEGYDAAAEIPLKYWEELAASRQAEDTHPAEDDEPTVPPEGEALEEVIEEQSEEQTDTKNVSNHEEFEPVEWILDRVVDIEIGKTPDSSEKPGDESAEIPQESIDSDILDEPSVDDEDVTVDNSDADAHDLIKRMFKAKKIETINLQD